MILGGLGASGAALAKKLEKVAKIRPKVFAFGGHFRPLSQKCGHRKRDCFSDPAFSAQSRLGAPKVIIMADLGTKK